MLGKFARLFVVTIVLLSGCVQGVDPAPAEIDASYKTSIMPPSGYERIYIAAPINGYFGNAEEIDSKVYVKSDGGKEFLAGEVSADRFAAFDVAPGSLQISVVNFHGFTASTQTFDVVADKTMLLQPLTYYNGKDFGLAGILITAGINYGKPEYAVLDNGEITTRVGRKTLTAISPEASAYVRQGAK